MSKNQVVDIIMLLASNQEFADAVWKGEQWAIDHLRTCESLNRGEPEGFRRPFDGTPRKWCGAACPSEEGCVTCTLPEDTDMARLNREWRDRPADPNELARQGIITISGEIDFALLRNVKKQLDLTQQSAADKLKIRIKSNGGDARCSLEIHDMIRSAPVRKRVGIVTDYAFSGAALILQACDWREAAPDARLLIHQIGWSADRITLDDLRDPAQVLSLIRCGEPLENRGLKILMDRTGRSEFEIRAVYAKEVQMTAQEALSFRLIDAIRTKS